MKSKLFTKISQFFGGGGTPYQRSKKEADGVKKAPVTEEFERCVMCGELTSVPVSTPIDFRDFYEVGCGQLCVTCHKKIRKSVKRENTLSHEQIMVAVEQCRKENK